MRRIRETPVNKVDAALTVKIREIYAEFTEAAAPHIAGKVQRDLTVPLHKMKVYCVDQRRGRAYYNKGGFRVITVPKWTFARGEAYVQWYVAHEMAHHYTQAFNRCAPPHGQIFMSWLKRICPENAIHHELGYKPRNAARAGIRRPAAVTA